MGGDNNFCIGRECGSRLASVSSSCLVTQGTANMFSSLPSQKSCSSACPVLCMYSVCMVTPPPCSPLQNRLVPSMSSSSSSFHQQQHASVVAVAVPMASRSCPSLRSPGQLTEHALVADVDGEAAATASRGKEEDSTARWRRSREAIACLRYTHTRT